MNKLVRKIVKSGFGYTILSILPTALMYPGKPKLINLELTNFCNLRCALCPYKEMKRKKEFMEFEKYKKLIDELAPMKPELKLWNWGDPLMHPQAPKMIKYAHYKGLKTEISTNLSMILPDKKIEELVKSGLNGMIIDIDGATEKTYLKYRIGGNFTRVLDNVKKINETKRELGIKTPRTVVQFLVTKENEKEMKDIKELCKEVGVDELQYKTIILHSGWGKDFKNEKERVDEIKNFLPSNSKYSGYDYSKGHKIKFPAVCPFVKQAAILANGDMSLCCVDYDGKYIIGNVFEKGFVNLWKSKKYKKFRKMIVKRQFPICKNCEITDYQLKNIKFLSK